MKVIEVTAGEKIPYSVRGTKITFDDELMLNLAKLERDFDVCVDVCINAYGMLVIGLGREYAAQVEIPARQYVETEEENPSYDESDPQSRKTVTKSEAVPFSMDNVTLKLYAI